VGFFGRLRGDFPRNQSRQAGRRDHSTTRAQLPDNRENEFLTAGIFDDWAGANSVTETKTNFCS
jgi:hypothetical protein